MPAPLARRRARVDTHHGRSRNDDLAWLRDRNRRVIELLRDENAWTEEQTRPLAGLRAALVEEYLARIRQTDESAPRRRGGWLYTWRTTEGLQYPALWRHRPGSPPAPVVDLESLAAGHGHLDAELDVSPDGAMLAVATDTDGSELYTLRFRDAATGTDLPDLIPGTSPGTAWVDGNRAVWYVRPDDAMRPYQAWVHVLGTDPATDRLAFEEPDERFEIAIGLSRTGRRVQLDIASRMTTEVWLASADAADDPLTVVHPREQGVEYEVEERDDHLVILTNAGGATDFKLVRAPLGTSTRDRWQELVAHRPGTRLEEVVAFRDHLVWLERSGGVLQLVVDGAPVPMPEAVHAVDVDADDDYGGDTLRYTYTSLVTPPTDIDLHLPSGRAVVVKQAAVDGYDPAAFETGRLWATAPDGAAVPISVVHRRGLELDGSHPALLYGYGAYEESIDPRFSALRLSLLERGVVFAIAHVRGGGELGRRWYEEGRLAAKPATFSDFIACAEHMVGAGYTSPPRLAIRGASAGGLLMGAVTNQRPDLFAAVVAEVPFVDILGSILDPSLPLTVTEWEEWGNPVESPAIYDVVASYAPVDNVHDAPYPAVLATAGLNDPRVGYWEPAKWVQRLRAHTTSGRPVLLKVDLGSGHQGPTGRYDAWADEAFVQAWILEQISAAAGSA